MTQNYWFATSIYVIMSSHLTVDGDCASVDDRGGSCICFLQHITILTLLQLLQIMLGP